MSNLSKYELLYDVEFNRYTNCMEDTVSNWDGVGDALNLDIEYISVPKPFIIKESDIDYYRKFGGGFKYLKFVGYLPPDSIKEV